jgi:hypothetical protein
MNIKRDKKIWVIKILSDRPWPHGIAVTEYAARIESLWFESCQGVSFKVFIQGRAVVLKT